MCCVQTHARTHLMHHPAICHVSASNGGQKRAESATGRPHNYWWAHRTSHLSAPPIHILTIFYWSKTIQHFQLCIFNISYRVSVCVSVCRYCQDFRHISARKSVGAVVVARRLRRRAPSMQTRAVESQVHSTEITQRVIYLSHNSI